MGQPALSYAADPQEDCNGQMCPALWVSELLNRR